MLLSCKARCSLLWLDLPRMKEELSDTDDADTKVDAHMLMRISRKNSCDRFCGRIHDFVGLFPGETQWWCKA